MLSLPRFCATLVMGYNKGRVIGKLKGKFTEGKVLEVLTLVIVTVTVKYG